MTKYLEMKDDVSIVLCGAAGQGIQTVEHLLTRLFKRAGYNLFSTKEYMSRVRGGSNSTEMRISSFKVRAYLDRIDLLFPLNREALKHVEHRVKDETIILGEKGRLFGSSTEGDENKFNIVDIPFSGIATEIGGPIYSNIVATGVIAALFGIDMASIADELSRKFYTKGKTIVDNNVRAAERGYKTGKDLVGSEAIRVTVEKNPGITGEIIISGGEAVSMGAIAGGCNFISSYPMTPSTAVLTFLAHQAEAFDIIVDQAEDEIEAMNMAIGAWYAGARAMVTTSGGGFDLMTEGLSLAGMLESPMVVHLAQRPGPATGLPTRTEQADLNIALYSGHGEFPRIILAPGTLKEAFELTAKAFNLADKYQVPVFILTDQYLVDSYYNIPKINVSGHRIESNVVRTDDSYKRYAKTGDRLSPRGIPGYGAGLVVVDSDEHDEEGHITENHQVRVDMVEKRLAKTELLQHDSIPPRILGSTGCKTMVVCWGSTFNIVKEAVERTGRDDVSIVHFSQVYPLHSGTIDILSKHDNLVAVEGNATSQFSQLLRLHTGIDIKKKINKCSGLAFSVEELESELCGIL